VPTIAYAVAGKQNNYTIRLAERIGSSWTSEDLPTQAKPNDVHLAFDSSGNPAVSFVRDVNGTRVLAFAYRRNGVWTVEQAATPPGGQIDTPQFHWLAFDPLRDDFAAICFFNDFDAPRGPRQLKYCERTQGAWSCSVLVEGDGLEYNSALAVAPDGTVYVVYFESYSTAYTKVRRPGQGWSLEYVDWNAVYPGDLRLGPDGQPGVAYRSPHDSSGIGREAISFARRTPPSP
jgi:hypothetical protein